MKIKFSSNNMSDEDEINISTIDDSMLIFELMRVKKFSKKLQLEAVKRNVHALQFFIDCEGDVKIEALKKDSGAITWCGSSVSRRVYNEFITHNRYPSRLKIYSEIPMHN
jgi:hypothetical protein